MFKGLRQKIGQGLASTPVRGVVPHALQEGSPRLPPTPETPQNVSPANPVSEDTPNVTPSGSLINLNIDESTNAPLQQEQTDSLIDLSTDLSGPAVLDISGSGSLVADFKTPRDRTTRSRTSSVSSQASDSFFAPVVTFVSRQLPLPSDVESVTSEAEDGGVVLDNISKEELYRCYCQMQQRSTKYRWKFSQVLKTYQEMEKERDKLRDTMTKSQDKAFRRISELKEQIHLDQLAKVDLEQNYMLVLEEKDEVIKVLRTQITLLKQGKEVPEEMIQRIEEDGIKGAKIDDGNNIADNQNEAVLKEKIARMSSLLLASKESISKNREQVQKLNAENARIRESLEVARMEKEQLQAAIQKKDQDFATLFEELKSEMLKLSNQPDEGDLKVLNVTGSSSYDQIEHLHRNLLSHVAVIQMSCQTSQEQLNIKDAENQKLHSENKRLMEEIAEQKRALKMSLSCGISEDEQRESANAAVEQNVCLCPKHRACLAYNILPLGESAKVGEEIMSDYGVTESSQTSQVEEHGAGESVQHQDFVCVLCEKEGQLVLASEKIHSCHEQISQLEEMVNQLRLECKPQNGCAEEVDQAGNQHHRDSDSDDRHRTALKLMEESHCLERTGLKEKIESLENHLQEVTDAHQSQINDAERQHQMELEELRRSFDAESEQMSLRLSKELENLKEEVTTLEGDLLRQQEAKELSERSAEGLRMEIDSQRHFFETRLSTIMEEKQNLEKELQTADERQQVVSAALRDVQNLKASLTTAVQEIVQHTAQEARDPSANVESQTGEVRQNQAEEHDFDPKGEGEEIQAAIKSQAEDGNVLTEDRMKEGIFRANARIEDLQNKNDSLHLLLHDWQGCVQMLKHCLEDKQAQNQLLKTSLQGAQLTVEKLSAQLVEEDEKWQARMEKEKELLKQELNHMEEEIKNRLTTKETELAGNEEKWQARMEEVKEVHKEELNHLQEEIKSLITTKETELAGNDEKWKAKLEEVTMLHKEELNRFEEEFEKLIAARGIEFALDDKKWQAKLEEVKNLHKEELNCLEEKIKSLIATKERELAGLQTTYKEEKEVSENEIEKLRNDCVLMEGKNRQLSDQLNVAEKQIENLLMTMHDLKNLKDVEEETLRRSLQEAMEKGEKSVESRIQLLNDQKDVLQGQLQELKQEFEMQLESLRSRNEALASELQTVKLREENLSQQVRELELMNEEMKRQHDLRENELKFLQEQLIELKVRFNEATEGEKSLADKLWLTEEQYKAAENQMEKLRNQEGKLQNKIQELLVQKDSYEKESRELCNENKDLKNELKNLKEQGNSSTKLQKALKVVKDKNESLSHRAKELEEQRNTIQAELQEMKEQNGSACEQIKELEEQRGSIERDLQELKDENGSLIKKVKDLEQQKDSLYHELVEFKDRNGSLNEQVKELEKQKDVSQKELKEHKDQIGCLCEQIRETEEQKESICKNVKELEEQHECTLKQLLDLKDQHGLLKAQMEDTETKKQSALQEMVQHESKILEEADILRAQVIELSSVRTTLENQLKQSEADSVSLKDELEKMKAEAVMLKEVIQQQEEKLKELQELTEMLSSEKMQKDFEVKEVKERLAKVETNYAEELFELRKDLCVLLNPEMSSVNVTGGHAEEIAALQKVVETELSSHLLGLNTQLDVLRKQSDDATSKAAELIEQLNAAEKKRREEEVIQQAERSALEVQNGELRSEIEKLNSLLNELQDQTVNFVRTQAICDKTVSEKDFLLKEAEEKLKVVSQEGDLKQMQLLASFEELQRKVAMLSDQGAESEKTASTYKVQSQASEQRLSELNELLTKSKNRLQETETKIETLSAEQEAERTRLLATIQELSNQNAEGTRISEENAALVKSIEERLKCDAGEHEKQLRNLKLDFDAVQEKLSTKTEQVIEFENILVKKDVLMKELEENLRTKISNSDNEIELLHAGVKKLEDLLMRAQSDTHEAIRKTDKNVASELDEKIRDREEVHTVDQLEDVILSHENRIHTLTESLLGIEKIKETLEAATEQLKLQNTEQLKNINAERDNLLKKLEVAHTECKNKDADILDLRKMNEEKDKILSELQEKVKDKEKELDKLQEQLNDLEGNVRMGLANEELIREKEKLIDELQQKVKVESEGNKSEIDRLKGENEDHRNEMNKVVAENEVNKSEIERLKIENEEQKREANRVQIENEEALIELNELKVKISRLNEKNQAINSEVDSLKTNIMDLQRERADLLVERAKAVEEKERAMKELEEKLLERSELEANKDEEHRKEMEATETRFLEKIKDLQRKFVIKFKTVQTEHDKALREANTENEELRLSKSALETQLENLQEVADQRLRTADELKVKLSELEKSQAEAGLKTQEHIVDKHQEDLEEKSYEFIQVEQIKGELLVKSHEDTEEFCGQEQVLKVSSYNATAEQEQLENTLVEIKEQLKQALSGKNEAQLKLEKSEEIVGELKQSIDVLKREIDEMKVKNEEELRLQAERLEAECSDKLTELKKKAEMRLKQIKNQIQTGKDSSIAELIQVRDDLTEKLSSAKGELGCQTELLREKEDEIQRLSVMLKKTEDKRMEETCSLRKESEESKQQLLEDLQAKENILEELKGKHQSLEDEAARLRQTIQSLEEEGQQQSDKLANLEAKCKGLKKQLVSAKHEIDRIKSENDAELRAAQLDKENEVARLMSEYKEQLKDSEIDNNSRIKQLVKEFQQKLAEKENEFQSTYMEALEKSQREEDIMIHQHKQEVKAMRLELREKEESFEESIQQIEVQLQAAEMQLEEEKKKSCTEIELLKQNIEQLKNELVEYQKADITTSNDQLESDEPTPEKISHVNPLDASASDSSTYINEQLQQDVIDLTKQIEELKIRYSLQVIKDQAQDDTEMTEIHGIETTDGSQLPTEQRQIQTLELHNMDLQAQVVQQCGDIARLKIRERALQHEVEVLHVQVASKTSETQSLSNEMPSTTQSQTYLPTELQYLKNVLLKFMTGTEQQTLARVICTVLKFSEEETQAVMNHLYNELY